MIEPAPETRAALAAALARAGASAEPKTEPRTERDWRELLEQLLLAASPVDASLLGQLLRESRAAWLLLLPRPSRATQTTTAPPESAAPVAPAALLVGRALAGTGAGLARLGWRVTLLDPGCGVASDEAELAVFRGACTGAPVGLVRELDPGARFDLVLVEEGLAEDDPQRAAALACGADLVALTADNMLAYKSSSGHRADFRVTRPWSLLGRLLGLGDERRATLGAHRRHLARALGGQARDVRAAALYPDRRDFTHAIDLDAAGPTLTLGPKERANRIKLAGYHAGLFATFAPSFGIWSSRAAKPELAHRPRQLDLLLDELWGELGGVGPGPRAEHMVATRGNSALVFTATFGASAGRWVVRVPLGHRPEAAARQNQAGLRWMRAHFPELPIPEPLFEHAGPRPLPRSGITTNITVETRLDGLGAGQLSGDGEAMGRLTAECGELLAGLVVEPAAPLDEAGFDQLFRTRFDEVRRRAAVPATIAALDRLQDELREQAIGLVVPRVACHSDLRPKHVIAQVTGRAAERGRVVGLVDWSCLDRRGLPLYDLVHLITSERAQLPGSSSRRAWAEVQDPGALSLQERTALETYERALDLPPEWRTVITRAYPILFGAMAEAHWDYSRPRWLRRLFGIGAE